LVTRDLVIDDLVTRDLACTLSGVFNLFAYGTLEFEEIFQRVTGTRAKAQPAELIDFGRYLLEHRPYPAVVPVRGSVVVGTVYLELADALLGRLDEYEGDEYLRRNVRVQLRGAGDLDAVVYVLLPELEHNLTTSPWDKQHFADHHAQKFLSGLPGPASRYSQ